MSQSTSGCHDSAEDCDYGVTANLGARMRVIVLDHPAYLANVSSTYPIPCSLLYHARIR